MNISEDFLSDVLPAPAPGVAVIVLCWKDDTGFMRTAAHESISAALATFEWLKSQSTTRDSYFTISTQAAAGKEIALHGRKLQAGIRNSAGAVHLKSLFLDVDVGNKEDTFKNKDEAVSALRKFLVDSGLPPPSWMNFTGSGGFHAFWCLDRPLPPGDWRALAQGLITAVQHHGFAVKDLSISSDVARLLRAPNSLNWKHDPPRPTALVKTGTVMSVEAISAKLARHMAPVPAGGNPAGRNTERFWLDGTAIDIQLTPWLTGHTVDNAMSMGIGRPTPSDVDVAKRCPWFANTLETGGTGQSYREWRLALRLSVYTAAPLPTAVEASKGDPRYTIGEVTREMDRIRIDNAARRELGPPLCKTINLESRSKFCKQCPRWPNTLANPKQSPLHALPTLVDPTFVKKLAAARHRLHAFYNMGGADVQKSRRFAAQVIRELKISDPLLATELAPSLVMVLARHSSSPAYLQSSAVFCGLSSDDAASLTNWTFNTLKKEELNHG